MSRLTGASAPAGPATSLTSALARGVPMLGVEVLVASPDDRFRLAA